MFSASSLTYLLLAYLRAQNVVYVYVCVCVEKVRPFESSRDMSATTGRNNYFKAYFPLLRHLTEVRMRVF
jgi:hypothetical protein